MSLATIQGTMVAEANTAAAFHRVDARFGGRLAITSPLGAKRTVAQQQYLYNEYLAGRGAPAWPPTSPHANHMAGISLDISNWASFPTLQAEMARDGFVRTVASEKWHYEHLYQISTAGSGGTPISADPSNPSEGITVSDVYAVEMASTGWAEYQLIALYGDVSSGWIEILPKDREGFFNPWRQGEAKARGLANATDIPLRQVTINEWNALKAVHRIPTEAGAVADAAVAGIAADTKYVRQLADADLTVPFPDGKDGSRRAWTKEMIGILRGLNERPVAGQLSITDAQLQSIAASVVAALPASSAAGATPDQVTMIVAAEVKKAISALKVTVSP